MADERDPKVSQRYRELGREEPPPALDQAILAASRRTAAPRRRWYLPLAAAAAAVLAVGVALHVQREQPDMEAVTAPAEVKEAPPEAKQESPAAAQPAPAQRPRKEEAPRDSARDAREFRFYEKPPASAGTAQPERQTGSPELMDQSPAKPAQETSREDAAARAPIPQTAPAPQPRAMQPAEAILGRVVQEAPEPLLERIAQMRSEGRHEEADKALAEFRRRYPDYRISQEMLDKVERK